MPQPARSIRAMAEDVAGKGHISRGVGNSERLVMFVPLVDGK